MSIKINEKNSLKYSLKIFPICNNHQNFMTGKIFDENENILPIHVISQNFFEFFFDNFIKSVFIRFFSN